ncbi:alanine/glycine:cation symporter family protein [Pontibaca methylaminivorans]|uniref:alanine/glycine:cation symporter family protein n=1 Tax=Pontibaca methylaminivorans TaxID=515897 RepID=UPI002FD9F1E5
MEHLHNAVSWLNDLVWGIPMIVLILGTGFYLQVRLKFMPLAKIIYGFRMIWISRKPGAEAEGQITPFAALMTALSGTIGTGNIAGVATAITFGGPGALFWMWATAFVGMATKYAEVVVAVKYREVDDRGEHSGGPMFAIRNGLARRWHWLGFAFALFGGLAGFGIGNMVQANSISEAMGKAFAMPPWATGVILTLLVGLVVLGGIKRIGAVAEKVVPAMAIFYILCVLVILVLFADRVPGAFATIFSDAFTGTAAAGGFLGSTVLMAIQRGVARGIFSNEAGLGTAGIAQAAGSTSDPVFSGVVGMMGTFIDTIIVCTMTGLAIMVTGVWVDGETGAALTSTAFETALPGVGSYLLAFALALFAFTTILGWAYYSEKCWEFLFGTVSAMPFRIIFTIIVFFGATQSLDFAWLVADTLNALMAIPNLVSLLLLSPLVVRLTNEYFADPLHR